MKNLWRLFTILMFFASGWCMTWEEFSSLLIELNDVSMATGQQTTTESAKISTPDVMEDYKDQQTTTESAKISTPDLAEEYKEQTTTSDLMEEFINQTTTVPQNETKWEENENNMDENNVKIREDTEEGVTTKEPVHDAEKVTTGNVTARPQEDNVVKKKVTKHSGFLYMVITVTVVTFGLSCCLLVVCLFVYMPSAKRQKKDALGKNPYPALTDVFSIIPTNGEIWKEMKHTDRKPELVLKA